MPQRLTEADGEEDEQHADRETDEAPDDDQQLGAFHPAMIYRWEAGTTAPIGTNTISL